MLHFSEKRPIYTSGARGKNSKRRRPRKHWSRRKKWLVRISSELPSRILFVDWGRLIFKQTGTYFI